MPYPHEDPRIVLLGLAFIGILWVLLAPGNGGASLFSASELAIQRLRRHQDALDLLNTSKWGDFTPRLNETSTELLPRSLNLTGFRAEDGFAWDDLERFQNRCLEWSHSAIPPVGGVNLWDTGEGEAVWQNATGAVKGTWVRREATTKREWTDYNLTTITPSLHWMGMQSEWARNITGDEGKIILDLIDTGRHGYEMEYGGVTEDGVISSGGKIRSAKASVTVEDAQGSGVSWDMRLHGVQWPRQGTILLTTTSEKFDGVFGLPHLTPGPDFFQSSQRLLNRTLAEVLRRKEKEVFNDGVMPWTSDPANPPDTLNPEPHCEYILYAQVHPPDRSRLNMEGFKPSREGMSSIINDIERELRFPEGAPIRGIPELRLSAVIWSPDCAFFLETKGPPKYTPAEGQHLQGVKTEVLHYKIRVWTLVFAGVILGQSALLKHQIQESATPSTMGRISYSTISMMAMVDGCIFAAASMWALDASITYLESLTLLFAAFLSMSMGGFFLAEIYKVQEPENRRRNEREQNSNSDTPQTSAVPTQNLEPDSLPRPVTAGPRRRAPTTPVIVPSDQDIDAEIADLASGAAAVPMGGTGTAGANRMGPEVTFQAVIFRFAMTVILIVLVSIASTSWYPRVRNFFVNGLAMVYFSFWVPQIYRNIIRNCRRALTWPFMIGQSVLRLLPFAYFYVYEDNFLFAETDGRAFIVFCAWLWIQLWILAFQFVLGPRFGIPKSWTPDAWDYHPVLREDGVEAGGLPIGLLSEPGSPSLDRVRSGEDRDKKSSNLRAIDCAICREVLEVPVMRAGEEDPAAAGVVGVFTRRNYMVTPCRHIFHSACLEGWMRFRLQCPICREELPPL
ncbi:Transmembrane E3 ubiquitin-protein ligase 1 [Colletotrichum chlorophyti]|uniref:DSC E3 ubiquitin ligase complex subunit A n=1 Tax=Colletotrichum chlorophyti TaxID=708187 RepID=A0A1Q8RB16_9PEZI|nr:Transmembrane E3 ubiquitin-protein ligase 1 [Colletotrichum chlorophyti]